MSTKSSVLRLLLKSDVDWCWGVEHNAAFEVLKQAIPEDMQLCYFDPNLPFEVQVEASILELGAAPFQNGKPVAFASKALTPAETSYANIERELLAVVYGLEKLHTYIFGRSLIVFCDHKPLENIKLKQLSQASPRLQRMLLPIQLYDIDLKYRPGKEMVYADHLSQITLSPGPSVDLEQAIHMAQISVNQLEKLCLSSKQDVEISALAEQINQGWPQQIRQVPKVIRSYWSMKDYMSVEDGLVYAGNRLVIPVFPKGISRTHPYQPPSLSYSKRMSILAKHVI